MKTTQFFLQASLLLLAIGCANERPTKKILANGNRIEKADVVGNTFLFAKTVTTAKFTGNSKLYEGVPAGRYVKDNVLIQFRVTEKTLDVVAIDPLFKEEKAALESSLIARFPVKHVDVLRKQNVDGEDTHEEEETDTRRPWQERSYIVVDTVKDAQETLEEDTKSASASENIEIDRTHGAINFTVTRAMKDNSEIAQRYSFLKFQPSSTYIQQEYPSDLQTKFGFFKTTTLKFDSFGRITQTDRKEYINHWDTSKKVIYYLSANYPKHLIQPTKQVFANWNEAFKAAVGHDVLEVRENTGQEMGDLRYSMITYDDTVDASHGILGYGPSYANPRTGEIIKADVILYGGVLRGSVYRERIWQKLLESKPVVAELMDTEEKNIQAANRNLLRSHMGLEPLNQQLLSRVSTLVSRRTVDRELLQEVRTTYHPVKAAPQIRKVLVSELNKNMTRLSESTMASLVDGVKSLSDEELELQVFLPLLTHELGHNLGLRHNFMGSLDAHHFDSGKQTSSVMDYGFLSSHEGTTPAAYDRAAILVAYANEASKKTNALADNYFFCTDESVFTSQAAYCNQFDAGTSLTQIANNQFKRYQASWTINNTRLDRVYFNNSIADYRRRMLMTLLSFRDVYDHATALVKAVDAQDIGNLWLLTRHRVEADLTTTEKQRITIKVPSGTIVDGDFNSSPVFVDRVIDQGKIGKLYLDAKIARDTALTALRDIILSDAHPDGAQSDFVHGELQIRGVLFDKILSLQILAAKRASPLGDGTVATAFPDGADEQILPTLFRQIVSNVILPGEPGSSDDPKKPDATFDINLRELAIFLIKEELSDIGLSSVMKGVLATEVDTVDQADPSQKALAEFETAYQEVLRQAFTKTLTEDEEKETNAKLRELSTARNRAVPFAQTRQLIGAKVFRAPLFLPDVNMITASGLFIREAINPYERMGAAAVLALADLKKVVDEEMAKPEDQRNKDLIAATNEKRNELARRRLLLGQIAESQRTLLDKMYRAFNPQ